MHMRKDEKGQDYFIWQGEKVRGNLLKESKK
jgi:hypothetical protein